MPERRKYDFEFRQGAATIVRETGRPIAGVARELGIGAGTLRNWVKKDRLARGEEADRARLEPGCVRGSSGRTPSCGWSVMCSSDPWSCGSRRRRDERGVVRRRPEDRPWRPSRVDLPGFGAQRVVVLASGGTAGRHPPGSTPRPRRRREALLRGVRRRLRVASGARRTCGRGGGRCRRRRWRRRWPARDWWAGRRDASSVL